MIARMLNLIRFHARVRAAKNDLSTLFFSFVFFFFWMNGNDEDMLANM